MTEEQKVNRMLHRLLDDITMIRKIRQCNLPQKEKCEVINKLWEMIEAPEGYQKKINLWGKNLSDPAIGFAEAFTWMYTKEGSAYWYNIMREVVTTLPDLSVKP